MFKVNKKTFALWSMAMLLALSTACTFKPNAKENSNNNNTNNTGGSDLVISPEPTISVSSPICTNGDVVAAAIYLPIEASSNTAVYYTTDGTDPESSPTAIKYETPFIVTGSTGTVTISAVSTTEGLANSIVKSKSTWFGDWEIVGTDEYLESVSANIASYGAASMFVDSTGVYLAGGKDILKYDSSSGWSIIGTYSGTAGTNSDQQMQNMYVENGIVYSAGADLASVGEIEVRALNGGSVTTLGTSPGNSPNIPAIAPCLGSICVAFLDNSNGDIPTVKVYTGGTWTALGTGTLSTYSSDRIELIAFKNVVYAAFIENNYDSGYPLVIKKFESGAWSNVGTFPIKAFNKNRISLFIDDDGSAEGHPFVAFNSAVTSKLVAYEFIGGAWAPIGGNISAGGFFYMDIMAIEGTPYISYQSFPTGGKVTTKRFDGLTWVDAGTNSLYECLYMKTTVYNGVLYRFIQQNHAPGSSWVESFGLGGSGVVSGGMEDPLGISI